MSHFTKGETKISNLELFKSVAKSMGLKISDKKRIETPYYTADCEFVVTDGRNGKFGIIKEAENDYRIGMDDWNNSIVDIVGPQAGKLNRTYQVELYKKETEALGGLIVEESIDDKGFAYLRISV